MPVPGRPHLIVCASRSRFSLVSRRFEPSGIWLSILRPSAAQPWHAWQSPFCRYKRMPSAISPASGACARASGTSRAASGATTPPPVTDAMSTTTTTAINDSAMRMENLAAEIVTVPRQVTPAIRVLWLLAGPPPSTSVRIRGARGGRRALRVAPLGILRRDLRDDRRHRVVARLAGALQLVDPLLHGLQKRAVALNQRRVADRAVARDDPRRLERQQLVERRHPRRDARRVLRGEEPLAHHHVAGEQHAIFLDEDHRVAARMHRRRPAPQQPRVYAAEIDAVLTIEQDVGRRIGDAVEQFGVDRRAAPA